MRYALPLALRVSGDMHPETKKIGEHMREFGSHTLGRAVCDCVFSEMTKPFAHAMSVTLAAHAGEIIVKARITQEHPLLIFETLPKSTTTQDLLSVGELFEYGRTLDYADLPEALWAATGYRMKEAKRFIEFGKLRNMIMHFAIPDRDNAVETLRFAFEVIDPMLQDFWDDSVVSYAEMWDEVIASGGYLEEQLKACRIAITDNTRKAIREAKT